MRKLLSALAATCLCLLPVNASARTTHDEQIWLNFTAMGSVSGDLVYFVEVQPRMGDGASRLDQLILRPAIGWKITSDLTVYQGYARAITPVDGGRNIHEDRSFQQISWIVGRPWRGELSSRTRLEQRWRSDGGDMGWRLREMVRLEVPVNESGKVVALGYAEAFVGLNHTDWGARGGFDQLRGFAGVEIALPGKSTIEAGYLNQYVNQAGGRSRMNHVLSLTLFLRH